MKKTNKVALSLIVLTALSCGVAYMVAPLMVLGGAVPALGGLFAAKAGSAKEMLQDAAQTILYLRMFLCVMIPTYLFTFGSRIINFFRQRMKNRKRMRFISLFSRVQTDLIFLKNAADVAPNEVDLVKHSKNRLVKKLIVAVQKGFFARQFDEHMRERLIDSLELIHADAISFADQSVFVDQWLRKLALFR